MIWFLLICVFPSCRVDQTGWRVEALGKWRFDGLHRGVYKEQGMALLRWILLGLVTNSVGGIATVFDMRTPA